MLTAMELRTPRLLLRECRASDHPAIHRFASDAEVTRYTVWGPNTPADTEAFLAQAIDDQWSRPRDRFVLAVVEQSSDAERPSAIAIGWVRLQIVDRAHGRAELGYALSPTRCGMGYATEAGRAILALALDMGLRKITATCDPRNQASARVLERLGMHRQAYLRDKVFVRGQWCDRLLYSIAPCAPLPHHLSICKVLTQSGVQST